VKPSLVRELRSVQRYSVHLPVCVNWRLPQRSDHPLHSYTRDISTRGMFVVADYEPALGELLSFEIDLALDEQTPLVLVRGEGFVVRNECSPSREPGFAVRNTWFRLCDPQEDCSLPVDFQSLATTASAALSQGSAPSRPGRHRGLAVVPPKIQSDSDRGE
jgi:hypothetical protein